MTRTTIPHDHPDYRFDVPAQRWVPELPPFDGLLRCCSCNRLLSRVAVRVRVGFYGATILCQCGYDTEDRNVVRAESPRTPCCYGCGVAMPDTTERYPVCRHCERERDHCGQHDADPEATL